MLETFLTTLGEMSQILMLLALGYLFNKLRVITRAAEQVLSRLATMLFLPSLTLYSNMMECKIESLASYVPLVMVGTAFCLVSILIGYPAAKLFEKEDEYQQGVYRYAMAIPNTGAVGTPLMLAFFGTSGLFQLNLFGFVSGILTYSWGIVQLQPSHGKTTFVQNLKKCINPQFLAMVTGMILGLLGADQWMPTPVVDVVSDLGSCYVTIALLLTGFSLADYPITEVFGDVKVYLYTLLRLILMPCLYLVIMLIFKAPLMLAIMVALTYASPCGMNVVIYPAAYNKECKAGASMVLISTLVSMVSVPVIYALVQFFFA